MPLREPLDTCRGTMSRMSQARDNDQEEDDGGGPGYNHMEMEFPGYNIRWLPRNKNGYK